jgi:hypothetical protein
MSDNRPTVFCDGVVEAQVAHGVARITLAVTSQEGKAQPCATLCVPVTQLPALVNGMGNLLKQIEERVKQMQQQAGAAPAQPAAGTADGQAGAFRFQS